MCLKIIGLGLSNYTKDYFNLFDAIIVTVSLLDWMIYATMDPDDIADAASLL